MNGWEFPENFAFFAFVVDKSILCFVGLGSYVSTSLPAVITLERFIAVYFPLRLKNPRHCQKKAIFIVTGILSFLAFFGSVFVYASWFTFHYHILSEDVYNGIDVYSQFFFDNADIMFPLYLLALNYLTSVFPISITVISCVLLALKIAQWRRRELTRNKHIHTSRTTRTLLAVSLVFALAHGTYFTLSCVLQDVMVAGTDNSRLLGEVLVALVLFSSARNFFVYVFLNSGFRNLFLDMTVKRIRCCKTGTWYRIFQRLCSLASNENLDIKI